MTREEMEELNGLAASMGLYEDRNPCKRAVILGKAIKELEQEPTTKKNLGVDCNLDDFIKYCKRTFGVELTVKKSDNPDTYVKLFGTTNNDLEVDWESYKDVDGNSLDDLILEVLQNNFDCGNTYGYKVADEIIGLLPSVTPQKSKTGYLSIDDAMSVFDDFMCGEVDEEGTETFLEMLKDKAESEVSE